MSRARQGISTQAFDESPVQPPLHTCNSRRLTKIKQLPQRELDEDDMHSTCLICISNYRKSEMILTLPCGVSSYYDEEYLITTIDPEMFGGLIGLYDSMPYNDSGPFTFMNRDRFMNPTRSSITIPDRLIDSSDSDETDYSIQSSDSAASSSESEDLSETEAHSESENDSENDDGSEIEGVAEIEDGTSSEESGNEENEGTADEENEGTEDEENEGTEDEENEGTENENNTHTLILICLNLDESPVDYLTDDSYDWRNIQ
ncbi:hypothetical protein Bhyg_14607 [Pseudolycoriella hygida]|uniref:Uncharacterized protein n=1 Tax=Pseudolycoriella hygida TaxID=35572 RepID=A0A9Q0MQ86_9DIPT|nr:hypothetical protein Bhyg_14607 [Pseudolycoriella hygida]